MHQEIAIMCMHTKEKITVNNVLTTPLSLVGDEWSVLINSRRVCAVLSGTV